MSFTTLITPAGKLEYLVNGDQARITLWALKGSRAFSQSTQCSADQARRHFDQHRATAF